MTYTLLRWLARQSYLHPIAVVLVSWAGLSASLVYAWFNLGLVTDRSALVNPRERYRLLNDAYQREFPQDDDLVVVIEGGGSREREHYVDDMCTALADDVRYEDVFGRTDLDYFRRRALLYLSLDQLKPLLHRDGFETLRLKAAGHLLRQARLSLEQRRPLQLDFSWAKIPQNWSLLLGPGRYHYHALAGSQIHVILLRPRGLVLPAIEGVQTQMSRLRPAYPELSVGLTGKLVIQADEIRCARQDSQQSTLKSALLVLALFALSFTSWVRPWLAFLALLTGVGWTLGLVALTIGHLNLLTITFGTMLVGLGSDFAIHILLNYEEHRAADHPPLAAMERTMAHAGVENMVGAFTSALAFAAICLTDFQGIAELGAIAGGGILLCFLSMVSLLPALVYLQEAWLPSTPQRSRPRWADPLAWLEEAMLKRSGLVLTICIGLTGLAAWKAGEVKFDYNLLHLQDSRLDSVRTELRLVTAGRGVLSAVSLASSPVEARELNRKFSRLPNVERVESVLPFLQDSDPTALEFAKRIRQRLKGVTTDLAGLESLLRLARTSPNQELREMASQVSYEVTRLQRLAEQVGPGPVMDVGDDLKRQVESRRQPWNEMLAGGAQERVTLDNLPASIRMRGVGRTGKIALRVYPKEDIWNHDAMGGFVADLQTVDPDVTGTPVSVYFHTLALKHAYERSGWIALGAITVILLCYFRNPCQALLALLPKLVAVVWMFALMALCHVSFNPANFIALPMILGIGLVFGVHVVHRLLDDPNRGVFRHSAGPSVALSALTTMASFITLMGASHQGIASLGFLMTVGVGTNLATSLILLPCLMRVLSECPTTRALFWKLPC